MNKFQKLIEELQTDLVIFIDDDFTPKTDPQEILTFICFSINESDFQSLLVKTRSFAPNLADLLNTFKPAIDSIKFDESASGYIDAGLIVELLENQKLTDLHSQSIVIRDLISENIISPENNFSTLIMNLGLVQRDGGVSCYKPFFDSLDKQQPRKYVRVYKELEGSKLTELKDEISEVAIKTGRNCFLLIVDETLANNTSGSSIITHFEKIIDGEGLLFFSVLFTSDTSKVTTQGHFHFAVAKPQNGTTAIEQVSDGLALCAYATFFYGLIRLKKNALEETERLIVSAKENILYLASMAHTEGDTVFNTINNWFNLLNQHHISKRLSEKKGDALDFDFITNLSSLITTDFLTIDASEISPEFTENVQRLNSFELFEDNINSTFCPPSPGDIYEIDSKLYILAGQECDLIVRGKGSVGRKEKLAELILCSKSDLLDNKFDDKTSENTPYLVFNYFSFDDTQCALKIEFNKRSLFDFRLLDLCSTNREGKSQFSKTQGLDTTAKKALPQSWGNYYPVLTEEITQKVVLLNLIKIKAINRHTLASDMSFTLEHSIEEDDLYTFPIRRIAQLKDQFKDYFLRRYWEYKTRKGMNTILPHHRKTIKVHSLKYGFDENFNTCDGDFFVDVHLTDNRNKNQKLEKMTISFTKQNLLSFLDEQFRTVVETITLEEIVLSAKTFKEDSTGIVFEKTYTEGKLEILITFPPVEMVKV